MRPTLQHVDYDDVFAAGDCAQSRAQLAGSKLLSYRSQADFLTSLNFGDGVAAGSKWGLAARGKWLQRWKTRIDRRFMQRFQFRTKR